MPNTIQLLVQQPCHENWDEMTNAEKGRFCQACQTTVTDFSNMNDKEIMDYLAEKDTRVCGRFYSDQLNRDLVLDTQKRNAVPYALNLLIATALTAGYAEGQVPSSGPVIKKEAVIPKETIKGKVMQSVPRNNTVITGKVLDGATMQPVQGASLRIGDEWNGVSADDNGQFTFSFDGQAPSYTITVSAVGYKLQEYVVKHDTTGNLTFYLDRKEDVLDTMIVKGLTNADMRSVTMGVLIVRKKVSVTEKAQRKVTAITPEVVKKKEVLIYPNPVAPGSNVDIALNVKQTGAYTIEILDGQGHVLHRQQIEMKALSQNIQVATSATWSKGVYWVRVVSKNGGKVFNGKLVLSS